MLAKGTELFDDGLVISDYGIDDEAEVTGAGLGDQDLSADSGAGAKAEEAMEEDEGDEFAPDFDKLAAA